MSKIDLRKREVKSLNVLGLGRSRQVCYNVKNGIWVYGNLSTDYCCNVIFMFLEMFGGKVINVQGLGGGWVDVPVLRTRKKVSMSLILTIILSRFYLSIYLILLIKEDNNNNNTLIREPPLRTLIGTARLRIFVCAWNHSILTYAYSVGAIHTCNYRYSGIE